MKITIVRFGIDESNAEKREVGRGRKPSLDRSRAASIGQTQIAAPKHDYRCEKYGS